MDAKTTTPDSYKIERRSMKNFSPEYWNDTLAIFNFCSQNEIENYPFKMVPNNTFVSNSDRSLRTNSIKIWKDTANSKAGINSFCMDTAKLWNNCPVEIKNATSIGIAKSAIKKFTRTLVI